MPSNHIIRTVYAFTVLVSPADKIYKTIPKVQNMWSQIGKKDFEKNANDFFDSWKEQLIDWKVQIAKACVFGLSSESVASDSSSTVLEAVNAIIEWYEALHGEIEV